MNRPLISRLQNIVLCSAGVLLVAGCVGGATTVKGDIKDDAIILATDHTGSNLRLALTNVGTMPCDLIVVLAPMPVNALPLKDGQVAIDLSGEPGSVRLPLGGGSTGYLKRVQPGETYEVEVALEGAPATDERIVLCNGVGDYEHGRHALLRFDR